MFFDKKEEIHVLTTKNTTDFTDKRGKKEDLCQNQARKKYEVLLCVDLTKSIFPWVSAWGCVFDCKNCFLLFANVKRRYLRKICFCKKKMSPFSAVSQYEFARKCMLTFAVCAQKSASSDNFLSFHVKHFLRPLFGKFNILFVLMHAARKPKALFWAKIIVLTGYFLFASAFSVFPSVLHHPSACFQNSFFKIGIFINQFIFRFL